MGDIFGFSHFFLQFFNFFILYDEMFGFSRFFYIFLFFILHLVFFINGFHFHEWAAFCSQLVNCSPDLAGGGKTCLGFPFFPHLKKFTFFSSFLKWFSFPRVSCFWLTTGELVNSSPGLAGDVWFLKFFIVDNFYIFSSFKDAFHFHQSHRWQQHFLYQYQLQGVRVQNKMGEISLCW